MGEMSTGRSLGLTLFTLVMAIILGTGVYTLANLTGTTGKMFQPISAVALAVTSMGIWVFLVMALRLFYLKNEYYDVRFNFEKIKGGYLRVQYLKNQKISFFQLFLFLFKPMRLIQTDEFMLTNNEERTLKGKLEVSGKQLFINNFYLETDTDLYEYIGEEVTINIVGNRREIIEKNVTDYIVKNVELQVAI